MATLQDEIKNSLPINMLVQDLNLKDKKNELAGKIKESIQESLKGFGLPGAFFPQALHQLHDLLHLDIYSIFNHAWQNSEAVQEILGRTVNDLETSYVPLSPHKIISEHFPYLEPVINGIQIAKIQFKIRLEMMMNDVFLRLHKQNIVEATIGSCLANITFAKNDVVIFSKENVKLLNNHNFSLMDEIQHISSDKNIVPENVVSQTNSASTGISK